MGDFKAHIDIGPLAQYLENFAKEVTKDIQIGIENLAKSTHNHIKEEVQNKLTQYDREKYLKYLSHAEKIDNFLWVITLAPEAVSIEEGKSRDMKGEPGKWGLLKNSKTIEGDGPNKGKHYKVIPFDQGRSAGEIQNTYSADKVTYQKGLAALVKSEIGRRGIPYRKIENESAVGRKTGNVITDKPRMGKLHGFDINSRSFPGTANTDVLHGINIYQGYNHKTNKIEKSITTFRTVIEGNDGKWQYPAPSQHGFFEEAKKWCEDEWQNTVLPALIDKYK